MKDTKAAPIFRSLADIPEERGVCGFRRRMVTDEDTEAANVSYLRINESRYHYHKIMTEFYFVVKGSGTITLDGEKSPIKAGDLIVIPPLVWHTSEGDGLEVLVMGVPPQETTDIYFE